MLSFKQLVHRRLTFTGGLMVVGTLCLLAGLLYGGYRVVAATILRVRVKANTPEVLKSIRNEREQIVSAIEAYHSHFGFYPPDHALRQRPLLIDPVTNQLFYELTGTVYNSTNETYTAEGAEALKKQVIMEFFNVEAIKNSGMTRDKVTRFLSADHSPLKEIHDDPDVMVLACGYVEGVDYDVISEFDISSWRYVSSTATNNPAKFDLWIQVEAGAKRFMIGNWEAAK